MLSKRKKLNLDKKLHFEDEIAAVKYVEHMVLLLVYIFKDERNHLKEPRETKGGVVN